MPQIKKEFVKAGLNRQKNLSLSDFVILKAFNISGSIIQKQSISIIGMHIYITDKVRVILRS